MEELGLRSGWNIQQPFLASVLAGLAEGIRQSSTSLSL